MPTKNGAYEAIARSLREFGYPDAECGMIRDTHEAMVAGKEEMPHGIIGMFAQRELEENDWIEKLPEGDE